MKITTKDKFGGREFVEESIERIAEELLDGSAYDTGQIETIRATQRNQSRAFGRLLGHLFNKSLLTKQNALDILTYDGAFEVVDDQTK